MKSISKGLILSILGGSLAAQSVIVEGRVLDDATGLPLVGANIIVESTNHGSATDLEGNFSLLLVEGRYKVNCSTIGYAPISKEISASSSQVDDLLFELKPITIESKHQIMVSGEKNSGHMLGQLQQTNLSTTENLISKIEGVNLISRGSYAQEPSIRGMSGGRMNITINGMKSFGACTDRMDPITSYVEADALNAIEIGKGALSIQNGSTVGGSLNLNTNQPGYAQEKSSQWHLKGGFDQGSQERKMSFLWKMQAPESGWSLSGAYRKAENYSTANAQVVPFTGFEKMNLNLGYIKRLNDQNQILVEMVTDDAYDIGYSALPMDVGYARLRLVGASIESLGLTPNILKAELKIYGNAVDHWMDDSKREVLFMDMHMDMPGFTRTAGSYFDLLLGFNDQNLIKLRSDFYWTSSYADMVMYPENSSPMKMVTWPGIERFNLGQFAEYQSQLTPKLNINMSARLDLFHTQATDEMGMNALHIYYPENKLKRKDVLFSSNAHLSYQVRDNWTSLLSLASGQRTPTVSEAYGYYLYNPVDGYLYLGNPDLPVETSRQIEWQNNLISERSRINLNAYYYRFSHYIFGQIMTEESFSYANGWKQYVDGGAAKIYGLEWSFLHRFTKRWNVQGGVTFEQSELVNHNDYLPMISPLEGHLSMTYQQKSYWLQIDTHGAVEQDQYSQVSGENATPAFLVFNLKGELDLMEGMKINMGVNNLTNQLYYEHLDWGDVYRPGRSGFLSITFDQNMLR